MTDSGPALKTIYKLTGIFGAVGFVWYLPVAGIRSASAFALGVVASLGNLWLFEWLSGSIAPGASSRAPWQAGAYVTRYVVLLGIGYAIVKALNVSPLAVVLGLLASAAAVFAALIFELISQVLRGRASH